MAESKNAKLDLKNIVHALLWRHSGLTAFTAREIVMILCGARRLVTANGNIIDLGFADPLDRTPDDDAVDKILNDQYTTRTPQGKPMTAISALTSDVASALVSGDFQCVGVDVATLPENVVERCTLWIAVRKH